MRYLSLFSGIGGFEKGIEQAYENLDVSISSRSKQRRVDTKKSHPTYNNKSVGTQQPHCIGFSEIDKYAIQTYQKHYPNHKNYGDITKINEKELPDFDLIVGGFPCQSFSIAGKRGGFADTRGTLFFEIARILKEKQPRLLLLENVKGLLSHDNGRTFKVIVSTLDELGYDIQWQVLNSKNFGVPQNRERVFIVGHLRGTPRPEVFPFAEAGGAADARPEQGHTSGEIASTVRSRYGNGTGSHLIEPSRRHEQRVYEDVAPTVQSSYGTGGCHVPIVMPQIRRLTPIECERLQGFPDLWTEGVSDSQRYKMLGNAITVNVVQAVMERIMDIPTLFIDNE